MKTLVTFLLLFPAALFGQGIFIPARTVTGTVNGITRPVPGAAITVCAANKAGIPCSPALTNTVFQDSGLTVPLSNPFFSDANGNYPNVALAGGTYTITESAPGFTGFSYQATLACAPGAGCNINGALNVASINATLNATQFSGADIGAQVNTAEASASCPANGCIIHIPAGSYSFSTKISITKPINLICDGATETSTTGPTQLTWTGGASQAIAVTTGAANTIISGCNLNNTGTGAVGIDIDSPTGNLDRMLVEKSAVFGFTVGIRLGNTAAHNTVSVIVKDAQFIGNGTNIQVLQAINTVFSNVAAYNYTTLDVQIGDSTHLATNTLFLDGTDLEPNNIANTDVVKILNAESTKFDDCYFESDGTGFAIDVPNTATSATEIVINNCRFIGAGAGNNSQSAFNSNLSTATWKISKSLFKRFAAASPSIIQNTSAQQIVFDAVSTDSVGLGLTAFATTGIVSHSVSMLGGVYVGGRVQIPTGELYIFEGPGQVQLIGGTLVSGGTASTLSGTGACATITTQVGGQFAGSGKCTGTTGASTLTITFGSAAPNGWTCDVWDETAKLAIPQSSHTTTTCVVTAATVTTNDVFVFKAIAF